jgi:hypothetical protein
VSSYTPIYVAAEEPPVEFTRGSLFQHDPSSAWWTFSAVGNWAGRFYSYAMADVIEVQKELEGSHISSAKSIDVSALRLLEKYHGSSEGVRYVKQLLTDFTHRKGSETVKSYQELWPRLVTKYHDGYVAVDTDSATLNMYSMFYPKWYVYEMRMISIISGCGNYVVLLYRWLEAVGFFSGPIVFKPLDPLEPGTISSSTNAPSASPTPPVTESHYAPRSLSEMFMVIIVTGCIGLCFGYFGTKNLEEETPSHNVYSVVSNNL